MDLEQVYLEDSWVLGVETYESHLCFLLDAVLLPGNPKFYSPPKPDEQHAYARLRWCLYGEVYWNEGPNLDHPATDASGERDFGNIDTRWGEGDSQYVEGSWGSVVIHHATQQVEYLD
jgi:hypothetical protein